MSKQEKIIHNRHSTRNFDPNYVMSREDQEIILKAGLRAPSPKNRQPWELIILDQKEDIYRAAGILSDQVQALKTERKRVCADESDLDMALATADIIRNVSMLVLVCYVRDERNEHGEKMDWALTAQAFEAADLQSIGACVENMLLTAEAMGIASLWICDVLYAEGSFIKAFNLKQPLVAAVAFGKAMAQRTPRYGLDKKAQWFSN